MLQILKLLFRADFLKILFFA